MRRSTGIIISIMAASLTSVLVPAAATADRVIIQPTPPPPLNKRVIEVVDRIQPGSWRVDKAVNWLDRYTTSDMRLVAKCSGRAYRCITIRQGRVGAWRSGPVGWSQRSTIVIDTYKAANPVYKRWYKYDANRTWLLVHELGHQYGLSHVGRNVRNIMNPYVTRYRMTLNTWQRTSLRKQ
jgi:hypothetical protein